ncbi:zinc finger domain-containing protein [Catenulispora acidiphila]|uniref:zinc finger domain-containing protein n=1 Tax=Catenulispora acidiphila TaxID=304895 RepID=UPI00117CF5DD|nr:hypothetical protein [Catenulispora acidiphila]
MDYFTFVAGSAEVEDALRRAWNACAVVACPKCHVAAGLYCRNSISRAWYVTRPHKPRQDLAAVATILEPVGIHGLSWAKGTGTFPWTGQRMSQAA